MSALDRSDPPPPLAAGRAAWFSFAHDVWRYAAANLVWTAVLVTSLTLWRGHPVAAALAGLALVPVAGGIGRMAAASVRSGRATWLDFREGLTHRASATWGLAAVVAASTLNGGLNIALATDGGGALLVLSALVSVHVVAIAGAGATAIWPLLMDPARDDQPARAVVREGLVALATRPLAMFAVAGATVLAIIAMLTIVATAFVVPALLALLAAFVVLSPR